MLLQSHTFSSSHAGPRLLVLGAVHGNEICGPAAICAVVTRFEKKELMAEKGRVTFVPVCNPRAYEQRVRFTEQNLNRRFQRHAQPKLYEEALMNELAPYLEDCDYLLDIHSYAAGGPAFAFRGPDEFREKDEPFIAALGVDFMLYGWEEAYAQCGIVQDAKEWIGTTEYVRPFGASATTLECGQHNDPACVGIATRAIEGALGYCGLVSALKPIATPMKKSRVKLVQYKERAGAFTRPLMHLDTVKKDEPLARYADGVVLKAPYDARLIMPKNETPIGQEWYYLAVDEE